jgi:nitrile hydratase accessory protein
MAVDNYDRLFGNSEYIARRIAAEISGPAAIPRRNGEPVFDEPWESRLFGAAVVLCNQGLFEWDEFRERLIAEIGAADAQTTARVQPPAAYYEHFLCALERLLVDKGICARDEVARQIELESAEFEHH